MLNLVLNKWQMNPYDRGSAFGKWIDTSSQFAAQKLVFSAVLMKDNPAQRTLRNILG